MASFETGATRNDDEKKYDPDGFLSPFALESYFAYMHRHRLQHDGKLRASDNWQLGIPMTRYMKSLWRHFFDVWKISRGGTAIDPDSGEKVDLETALNGVLFNTFGLLHEMAKKRQSIVGSYPEHSKPDSTENWQVASVPERCAK